MKLYIGIDISKDKLDISLFNGNKFDTFQILNNESSIKGFIDYLKQNYKKYDFYFGYEATNNYMLLLKKILQDFGYKQIMLNPYQISYFLKVLDMRDKTDLKDCIGISKYLSNLDDKDFKTIFSFNDSIIKKYNTTIQLLSKIETQLSNLIKSQEIIEDDYLDDVVKTLKLQIKKLKKDIEKQSIKILKKLYPQVIDIKKNIKGVGYSLLLHIIPIISSSKNYTVKQLQSYIGLTPRSFSSGSSIKKKEVISKKGNSTVRKILYMSALSAIRFNPIIKEKYENLLKNGKEKMVAIVACMAHLFRAVVIMFRKYSEISKAY